MIKIDGLIKDFIWEIRKKRDLLFKERLIPKNAKVELTQYKPKLWKSKLGFKKKYGNKNDPAIKIDERLDIELEEMKEWSEESSFDYIEDVMEYYDGEGQGYIA